MQPRCPVCRAPLQREDRAWRCAQNHSFDIARQGYVNLLLVQQKHSPEPGDSAESLRARRDFLDAGHYAPLRAAVLDLLRPLHAASLLDIGCGEGYYTAAMSEVADALAGLDIARPALQLAAKRSPRPLWLVGTGAALPFDDATLDVVTGLFIPLHVAEMARVLKPGGHALIVTPAAAHLHAMREALFDRVEPHVPDKFLDTLRPGFELVQRAECRFPLALDGTALRQLLQMTPYVWKARPERRAALEASDGLNTEAAFALLLFRRCAADLPETSLS